LSESLRSIAAVTSYDDFLALHQRGNPLLIPNPWDRGTARVLAGLGFQALATTSGGFAASSGVQDGGITREQALEHSREIAGAVDVPVSADLENGFAHAPADVAETVRRAADTGLAGCSIEDYGGADRRSMYDFDLAVERVAAAAEAAHAGPQKLVLTARAENFLRGNPDLDDTIARVQRFAAAGADVVYAPGMTDVDDIRTLISAVDVPVNVLILQGGPSVAELADAGAARISVGSHFTNVAFGALVAAGREFLAGDGGFLDRTSDGRTAISTYLPKS
jgi:2-methylisocitrate lyase-like PEP mutase family enzyme